MADRHRRQSVISQNPAGVFAFDEFLQSNFGDIDLHQLAYDGSQQSAEDDLAIWQRAMTAEFSGVGLHVPPPADRIALAIAHGGLDAHTHSDWLVDCAVAIRGGDMDRDVFIDIVTRRDLAVAAVALSYLAREIGIPVPEAVLLRTVEMADRAGLSRWSSVLQAKPRTDFGGLSWLSRGFAKQLRPKRKKGRLRQPQPDVVWRGKPTRKKEAEAAPFALSQAIPYPQATGDMMLDVTVRIVVPPVRRRIEMEINGLGRHVARLRSMVISRSGGERVLRFRGKVTLEAARQSLVLEARAHPASSAPGTIRLPSPPMERCLSSSFRHILTTRAERRHGRLPAQFHPDAIGMEQALFLSEHDLFRTEGQRSKNRTPLFGIMLRPHSARCV